MRQEPPEQPLEEQQRSRQRHLHSSSAICAILFDLEGIGIGGAVVSEVRVGDSAGHGHGCSIRDRAAGRGANRAGRLIGDFAA